MRKPETLIIELLRDHECVIIPGFGGFLARYSTARINTLNSRIIPPGRSISFNQKLNTDDGLLVSYFGEAENLDYDEAKRIIEGYADSLKTSLKETGRAEVSNIGTFTLDKEQNLSFEPEDQDDLWDEGFGLSPLYAVPVIRDVPRKRTYPAKKNRTSHRSRRRTPVSVKLTLAVAVPIIVFLVYGIFNPSGVKQLPANYSSLIDLERWSYILPVKPDKVNVAVAPLKLQPISYNSFTPTIIPEIREAGDPDFIDHYVDIPEIIGDWAKTGARYYIIGASFTRRDQAMKLAEELNYNGFQPALISDPDVNRYRVSYYSFRSKKDALEKLALLRKDMNPEAWLLKK